MAALTDDLGDSGDGLEFAFYHPLLQSAQISEILAVGLKVVT